MAAPVPYIPFYPSDYLADAAHLTTMEHGAYFLLLMNYWQRAKPLPANEIKLARIARCSPEEWNAVRETVLEFFVQDGDFLYNNRLEKEIAIFKQKTEQASRAGRASADARTREKNPPTGLPGPDECPDVGNSETSAPDDAPGNSPGRPDKARTNTQKKQQNERPLNDRPTPVERPLNARPTPVERAFNHTDTETDTDTDTDTKRKRKRKEPPPSVSPAVEFGPEGIIWEKGCEIFSETLVLTPQRRQVIREIHTTAGFGTERFLLACKNLQESPDALNKSITYFTDRRFEALNRVDIWANGGPARSGTKSNPSRRSKWKRGMDAFFAANPDLRPTQDEGEIKQETD